MAQITIYLPDSIANQVRKRAAGADKSLSAYVAEIVARDATEGRWPKTLLDLLERGGADLVEPADPSPEDPEQIA